MKKFNFFILAWLCLVSTNIMSQGSDIEQAVSDAMSQLSTTEITTGIHYDRVPAYYPFSYNTGKYVADSITMSKTRFMYSYGMLDNGHVDTSYMIPTDSVWDEADWRSGLDFVDLFGLYYRYNRFKPYAIDSNLISWDSTYFHDVPGRPESPYLEDTVFAFTALRHEFEGDTVPFFLPSTGLYTNMNWDTTQLSIDFDDGAGFTSLVPDSIYYVVYTTDSLKRIRIRYITPSSDTLISQTYLYVHFPPPPQKPIAKLLSGTYNTNRDGFFRVGNSTQRAIWGPDPSCTDPNDPFHPDPDCPPIYNPRNKKNTNLKHFKRF